MKQGTLYHGVLFGARGMFKGYVRNRAVTTYEVRTLAMYMEQIYGIPRTTRDGTDCVFEVSTVVEKKSRAAAHRLAHHP
jgi:hypothetical protein